MNNKHSIVLYSSLYKLTSSNITQLQLKIFWLWQIFKHSFTKPSWPLLTVLYHFLRSKSASWETLAKMIKTAVCCSCCSRYKLAFLIKKILAPTVNLIQFRVHAEKQLRNIFSIFFYLTLAAYPHQATISLILCNRIKRCFASIH